MQMFIIIILIVLFLLAFVPISFAFKISYNVLTNKGSFKVNIFKKLKIFNPRFKIINKKLVIIKRKGKKKILELDLYDPKLAFYNELQKALLKRLMVKRFYFTINLGAKNNAFLTSMLGGYTQVFLATATSYLKCKNSDFNTRTKVNTYYDSEKLNLTFSGQIYISVVGLILSVSQAYYKNNLKQKKVGKSYGK
jgi:hypothetical protein